MTAVLILSALGGLLAGAFSTTLFFSSKISQARAEAQSARDALMTGQLTREKLEGEFRSAAADALKNANEQFLSAAIRDLRQVKTEADFSVDKQKSLIETSVGDMKNRLEETQKLLRKFEDERHEMYGKIDRSLEQVLNAENLISRETSALKKALTSNSGVRGKWGELVLERIFEQNEMVRGRDFDTQVAFTSDSDADLRPDFVIHLPGKKRLIVDSKEVTGEYLLAQDTDDVERQKEHYGKLVSNIRNNFMRLGKKEYQDILDKEIPFVVMFIPSESAIRAAFATDPGIFEEAKSRRVILASPMTIIPLIHLIKYSWQKQTLADNALELGAAVETLGSRLGTFMEHLNSIRGGLKKAVEGWNEAASSWQTRLSPQIEKTKALGGKLKDAGEPQAIDSAFRPALETSRNA